MPCFEDGLQILIEHLQGSSRNREATLQAAILERIQSLGRENAPQQSEGGKHPLPGQLVAEPTSEHVPDTARAFEQAEALLRLRDTTLACRKCAHLVEFRTNVVFGVGNPVADLMFIGEAPGADEDLRGEPFVGRAGQLLTRIIQTMGFTRETVYIANVLKCRPDMPVGASGNRVPTPEEMQTCLPYLRAQIEIIRPKVLVALGSTAMRGLLGLNEPMKQMRGRWHSFGAFPVMATFHPSYLLRNQALTEKRKVWEDMLQVLERLGKPISARQKNFFLA
jgi:uracil-DNA glycosylase